MTLLDDIHHELGHDALVKWDRALIDLPEESPEAWDMGTALRPLALNIADRAVAPPKMRVVSHDGRHVAIWDGEDWHGRILPHPAVAAHSGNESLDAFERRAARARPEPILAAFVKTHGQWDPMSCGTCRRVAEYLGLDYQARDVQEERP